jgi:amidohydrolase
MDEQWRAEAHKRLRKIALSLVESMGGQCIFVIRKGYPELVNEAELTVRMRKYAEDFLGADQVVDLDSWMAAEDAASYAGGYWGMLLQAGHRQPPKGNYIRPAHANLRCRRAVAGNRPGTDGIPGIKNAWGN